MPLLDLILGYDCNLYCDYCTISLPMRRRSLDTRAVLIALRQGRQSGYDRVSFTGGEPTLRPDLLSLVRTARTLGYQGVKLQSNGLLFGQARNVQRLVEVGVDRFHVSIHTHLRDAYERLVQRSGTYDAMVAGLRQLVDHGLDPTADVILKADTYRRLPAAVQWLHELGVRRVDLWFVSLTDQNRDNPDSMPRMTEVVPMMAEAFAWGRAHAMTMRSLHVPACLLGDDADHAHNPAAEGVRVVSPDATFDLGQSRLTGQIHVQACQGCPRKAACAGLRQDYLDHYGDDEIAAARGSTPSWPSRRRLMVV